MVQEDQHRNTSSFSESPEEEPDDPEAGAGERRL